MRIRIRKINQVAALLGGAAVSGTWNFISCYYVVIIIINYIITSFLTCVLLWSNKKRDEIIKFFLSICVCRDVLLNCIVVAPPRIIFSADGCRHGNFPMLSTASPETTIYLINWDKKSMGNGKMMVEFFSAEMVLNVCSVFRHSIWKSSIKSEIYIKKKKKEKTMKNLKVSQL